MQEVICLSIGQAGIQISNAAWELFCIEHGIEANGRLKASLKDEDSTAFKTFFCESSNGQFVPRTVTIDLEPTVIDEIRTGSYRDLFHPDQLINAFDDGSNNFARAHFSIGKTWIPQVVDAIRKASEDCNGLQGFFLLHSHGGGTGSGFTSLVMKSLNIEFAKTPRLQLSVFPSPILASSVVEPYNCVLSSTSDIEQSDITIIVNNEALYGICIDLLNISRPSFSSINRVITHVFSDLTVSLRFESSLTSDFSQMSTNLIPYPRIHFPLVCYAPLVTQNRAIHESLSTQQITRSIFKPSNQLITCDSNAGLYMSCVMQYRGNVTPKDVNGAIFEIKRDQEIKFVDWCPTGFKIGINSQTSTTVPGSEMAQTDKSLTMVSNTTAIKDPIEKILFKFEILFQKRAFIHWFVGEGMEEGEFNEAREEIATLIADFVELSIVEEKDDGYELAAANMTAATSRGTGHDVEIDAVGVPSHKTNEEVNDELFFSHGSKSKVDEEKHNDSDEELSEIDQEAENEQEEELDEDVENAEDVDDLEDMDEEEEVMEDELESMQEI